MVNDSGKTRNSNKTRKRWLVVGLSVSVAVVVVLIITVGNGFGFNSTVSEDPKTKPNTVKVVRETITVTLDKDGELSYATELHLRSSQGLVTWLPQPGGAVNRGETLAKINNQPITLLYGDLPFYRDLSIDSEGPDVKELEENLAALGYTGFDVNETYTYATASAVKKWQDSLGLNKTGEVSFELLRVAPGPLVITTRTAAIGDQATGEILTAASTERIVKVNLKPADIQFAKTGATVTLSIAGAPTVPGKITATETRIVKGTGENPTDSTVLQVTVKPDDLTTIPANGTATVKVNFVSESKENVLTVPITALLALSEGGYAVQTINNTTPQNTSNTLLAVKPGLFANGKVEITGDNITEGLEIVVPK